MAFKSIRLTGGGQTGRRSSGIAFAYSNGTKQFSIRIARDVCEKCNFIGKVKLDIQHDPETKRLRLARAENGLMFKGKSSIQPQVGRRKKLKKGEVAPETPVVTPVVTINRQPVLETILAQGKLDLAIMKTFFGEFMDAAAKTINCHAVEIECKPEFVEFTLKPGRN